jgi:hypothetical protein
MPATRIDYGEPRPTPRHGEPARFGSTPPLSGALPDETAEELSGNAPIAILPEGPLTIPCLA